MLTETILNKKGLDGICTILHRLSGGAVFITSPGGSLLACHAHKEDEEDEEEEQTGTAYIGFMKGCLEEYFARPECVRLKRSQCNLVSPQSGVNLGVVPVFVQEEHIAYLVLDTGQTPMMDMDMVAFAQAASTVAVELLNEQALWQREQKIREQLLEDLTMKRYSDEKMIIQRGRHLGIDLTERYCLFVVDADSFEEVLKGGMLGDEAKVQKIKEQVQQRVREAFSCFPRPSLILDSSMGVMGLFEVRGEDDVEACMVLLDSLISDLGRLSTGLRFSAGVGRVKQGIALAGQGLREAQLAMRAGRGLRREGKRFLHTHSFAELGCLSFLCEMADSRAMREFYEENMSALLAYDRENNAEMVKTLDDYFASKQNLRKTAETLFVHKNSVIYRLGKVEALLGKPLSDPQTAFDLQLCLKLRSLY